MPGAELAETAEAREPREKMGPPKKIRFAPAVLAELERIAAARGSTLNEVVRRYVNDGLDNDGLVRE